MMDVLIATAIIIGVLFALTATICRVERHGDWKVGYRCVECRQLFESGEICPKCGRMDGHNRIPVRYTWTQPPQIIHVLLMSLFGSQPVLEEKERWEPKQ